jgi:hypothetical protein
VENDNRCPQATASEPIFVRGALLTSEAGQDQLSSSGFKRRRAKTFLLQAATADSGARPVQPDEIRGFRKWCTNPFVGSAEKSAATRRR